MEERQSAQPFWSSATALLVYLALIKVAIHFLTNGNYGYFRDELYYIACSEHLDWGYVDQPPLSILILKITRVLLGDSIFAIRLPVVLVGAACVFLTGLMARELGGGRFAQSLAALAYMVMGVPLVMASCFSMNAFDYLFWIGCALTVIRIVKTNNPKPWLVFGLVAGIAMMNKISIAFFAFGIVVGLLLTPQRKQFLSPWIWLGGALAFLIFLPNVIWQATHDFPTLEFMSNARKYKISPMSPLGYLSAQIIETNPFTAPIWLVGLGYFLFAKSSRPLRPLGWAYVAILLLFIIQQAKAYYLAPAYAMLVAAGAVAIESFARRHHWNWLKPALIGFLVLGGVLLAPMAIPVLPPETYLRYQRFLGIEPPREERDFVAEMPQHFGDRFGWENMVATVAQVYNALPAEEQARCAIVAGNYGEAGAVDFFGPRYGLPKAICGHNNYWLWGPRDTTGEIAIWMSSSKENLEKYFEEVELAATVVSPHARETGLPIHVCRKLKRPIQELWPQIKDFI